jgi:tetratricopeptide (TPR) repeat protein
MNTLPGMPEPWSQRRPPGAASRWFARFSARLSGAVLLIATIFLDQSGWAAPAEPAVARTSRLPPPAATSVNGSPRFQDFVGSDACAKCHAKEFAVWKKSTHGQAGGRPDDTKIIARFDRQPLQFKDAIVTPTTNRLGEYVFQLALEGRPAMEIKVDAVVGGGHMLGGGTQSFFNQYPDGTVRFLPFDFIRRENLWFVQLRKDLTWVPISKEIALQTDLANWPPHRVLGTATEFSNCQNCHGSQITLRYDEPTRRYETRIQTLKINCESCHGPGRRHVDLVSQPGFDKLPDIGMKPLATLSKDESVMVCLQCHAKKDAIREEEYLPGASLEDYFSLKLGLLGDSPYRVDGRVRSFDYQGNHLFSDCYRNGSMTCVDCHDPHGQGYRDVFLKPLTGKLNNGQCTSCHASKAVAPERHSHHKPESPGNQCVSCHMPFLQHQGVGTHLAFARSDHSIPIPRPEFDHQLGIENACHKCHQDKDLAWQEARVKEWYGELKPHPKAIASLLQARDTTDPQSAAKQLLLPDPGHLMAQAAALATWIERFLSPNQTRVDPDVVEKLKTLAQSPDLDLKSMALMSLHLGYDQSAGVRPFLVEQLRTLGSREEAVRNRWAIAADKVGSALAARGDLPNAILSLDKSLEANPSNYVSMSHLALAHLKSGNASNAVAWLKNAIQLKPHKATLHFQLAQTYAQQQQIPAAIRSLEEGLKYAPNDATARRMLQFLRPP